MRAHSSVHILNSVLNSYLVVTTQTSSCVKNNVMSFSFALFNQKFSPEGKSLPVIVYNSMSLKLSLLSIM